MLELRILGPPELRGSGGQAFDAFARQPKRTALFAYLAAALPRGLHRRDKLVALFWPELDEPHARNALSQALYVLRTALGERAILSRGDGEVGLNTDVVWCDVPAFDTALHAGRPTEALALYRGDLLDGLFVSGAPDFERWLDREREHLRRRAAEAASHAADAEEREGHAAGVVRWARRAVEIAPYEEAPVRRLIESLDRAGDRADAIREYLIFRQRLKTDLNVEPSPETLALVEHIRTRAECFDHEARSLAPARRMPAKVLGHRRKVGRRTRLIALGLVPVLAGAWIAWQLFSERALAVQTIEASPNPSAAVPALTRVAVFPFKVQGRTQFDYLGEGTMDALSQAIDGLGELRRVQPFAVMSQVRREAGGPIMDPRQAARIAVELGARRYVLGSVVDLGGELRISASMYDPAGGSVPLAEAFVQGAPDQLATLMTRLTRQLVAGIPLGAGVRLHHVGTIVPANFDAFKAYLQGEALLRRGWYDSAAARLRDAVSTDSTFALAWYRLGLVLGLAQSFGREGDNYTVLGRAARYGDRLSRRDRLMVDGWRAHFHGKPDAAERLAREVLGGYPDDVEAWHLLGLTRMWYAWQRGRPYSEARAALHRALMIDPHYPDALYHAYALAIIEARYAEADSLMSLAPEGLAVGPWAEAQRGVLAFALADRGAQDKFMRSLDDADDQALLSAGWILANHSDSLTFARRVLTRLTHDAERSDWGRAQAQIFLAHVEAARGRWGDARAEFARGGRWEPGLALSSYAWLAAIPAFDRPRPEIASIRDSLRNWQGPPAGTTNRRLHPHTLPDVLALPDELRPWIRDYLLGLLSARLGDHAAAQGHAATLEKAQDPHDTIGLRYDLALEIRALTALEVGRPDDALDLLEKARMTVAQSDQAWYPRYYSRPFGRFLRAEALRLLGRHEEALGWYGTFGEKYGTEYVYRAAVFLRQGEIHERRGDRQRALESYRRFVARWRLADPEYHALLRAVEARIGRLAMRPGG